MQVSADNVVWPRRIKVGLLGGKTSENGKHRKRGNAALQGRAGRGARVARVGSNVRRRQSGRRGGERQSPVQVAQEYDPSERGGDAVDDEEEAIPNEAAAGSLLGGRYYFVRIKAHNALGWSNPGPTLQVKTKPPRVPQRPDPPVLVQVSVLVSLALCVHAPR